MSHKAAKRDRKAGVVHTPNRLPMFRNRTSINLKATMPEDKGKLDGSCNRSACLARPANWYNKYMDKYYCAKCGDMLNKANPDFKPFCHPVQQG